MARRCGSTWTATAAWRWTPLERTAEVLEETEEALVVVPDVADAFVFAGVNILDKRAVTAKEDAK